MAILGKTEAIYIVCCICIGFALRIRRSMPQTDDRMEIPSSLSTDDKMEEVQEVLDSRLNAEILPGVIPLSTNQQAIPIKSTTAISVTGTSLLDSTRVTELHSDLINAPQVIPSTNFSFFPIYSSTTRRRRVVSALPDLFNLVPTTFINYTKNPCWMGRYRDDNGRGALQDNDSLMCMPGTL